MKTVYKTKGTCTEIIELEVVDGVVKDSVFSGGCVGNTLGISTLIKDMKADEVIEKFDGLRCGRKKTSCPDQLATALKEIIGNSYVDSSAAPA